MLEGKKILLCVTGGIAVYKAAALTSKLIQAGANVRVILSQCSNRVCYTLDFSSIIS